MNKQTSGKPVKIWFYDKNIQLAGRIRWRLYKVNTPQYPAFELDIVSYKNEHSIGSVVKSHKIDAIVSPGNSFGFLGGGLDAYIAEYYSSAMYEPVDTIEKSLQNAIAMECAGYNPPGNTLIVDMDKQVGYKPLGTFKNPLLLHLPTMSVPSTIKNSDPLIFNCVWGLLSAITKYNYTSERQITGVLLSGLGTGVGKVPDDDCARQIVEAFDQYNNRAILDTEGKISKEASMRFVARNFNNQ